MKQEPPQWWTNRLGSLPFSLRCLSWCLLFTVLPGGWLSPCFKQAFPPSIFICLSFFEVFLNYQTVLAIGIWVACEEVVWLASWILLTNAISNSKAASNLAGIKSKNVLIKCTVICIWNTKQAYNFWTCTHVSGEEGNWFIRGQNILTLAFL